MAGLVGDLTEEGQRKPPVSDRHYEGLEEGRDEAGLNNGWRCGGSGRGWRSGWRFANTDASNGSRRVAAYCDHAAERERTALRAVNAKSWIAPRSVRERLLQPDFSNRPQAGRRPPILRAELRDARVRIAERSTTLLRDPYANVACSPIS